ncbi:M23 family metallopeptidase [Mucilaginibacter robiniae]|uniref:M23 family metallopeptidase n=1 Tax=Mucilaginibacter robiniae TaxID=2728022 RepID=A0A7L5E6C2_9SPHI|nr:M23 family metallopeptidase [Mucilaginibacter robiniae]QJD95936.1 M23 family metallopeptidase [Mucilaginibacter robiniae]
MLALLVCLPLRHLHINSSYGYRWHPLTGRVQFHQGVDLHARHDTVFAVLDGAVRDASFDTRLGCYVALQHGAVETIYGHLSQAFVLKADSVTAGQPIGITGATGRVTGEHLHFAVRYRNRFINPLQFLRLLLR